MGLPTRVAWLFGLIGVICAGGVAAQTASVVPDRPRATPVEQVFLIQNSGWMEPFYTPQTLDRFRAVLKTMITAITDNGMAPEDQRQITIATFNQDGQVPGRHSPYVLVHELASAAAIDKALGGLDLPHKANAQGKPTDYLTDSDFEGAIRAAIGLLGGGPGIVWLVTNNTPSPNNDPNVGKYNHSLLEFLSANPALKGVQANPFMMPVRGQRFPQEFPGFMVYGFAFGDTAAEPYLLERAQAASNAMGQLFGRLRPLDLDPLDFQVRRVEPSNIMPGWDHAPDGRPRLVLTGLKGGQQVTIKLIGTLKSEYYPLRIEQAKLCGEWEQSAGQAESGFPDSVTLTFDQNGESLACREIGPIEPGAEDVAFSASIVVPEWQPKDRASLYENGLQRDGEILLQIKQMVVSQRDDFVKRIGLFYFDKDYSAAKVPEVYLGYKQVRDASITIPVRFDIPPDKGVGALVIASIIAAGFAAASGLAWLVHRSSAKVFPIMVGTAVQDVPLKLGASRILSSPDGRARLEAKRGILGRLTTTPLPPRNS
jgi:hypothetical protein